MSKDSYMGQKSYLIEQKPIAHTGIKRIALILGNILKMQLK